MAIKKILLLDQVKNPTADSIHSATEQRQIVFSDDMIYAVILASRYGGKGYTTHSNLNTTSKKIRQRNIEHEDYVVIDIHGQRYFKDYQENGKFILSKVTDDPFVDHTVLKDNQYIVTWERPAFGGNIEMQVEAKGVDSALSKFRKKYRGVENLKITAQDSDTDESSWILYSCGVAGTESLYVRDVMVKIEQSCVS